MNLEPATTDSPFEEREYPPERIRGIYEGWEKQRNNRIEDYKRWEAMLASNYWSNAGIKTDRYGMASTQGHTWIEVNSLYPFIMSYASALTDPDQDAVVRRGSGTDGDPEKVYEALKTWRRQVHVAQTIQQADILATLYDGVAAKVWYDEKKRDPLRRVMVKIIPWWEVMPDEGVTNASDADFVAHCYWMPVVRARRMFRDRTIKGVAIPSERMVIQSRSESKEEATDRLNYNNMVRVVEFYNLRDPFHHGEVDEAGIPISGFTPTPETVKEMGRVDFYLPSEPSGWRVARRSVPFQFRDVYGDPVLPINIYTLMSHPGFPLNGQAQTPRVFDLAREKNVLRSARATVTRRDMPQLLAPRGLFGDDEKQAYKRGEYGHVHEYDPEMYENVAAKVIAIPTPNMPYDHTLYSNDIERDIERASLQPPATRGRITGATATEVLEANKGGDGEVTVLSTNRKVFLVGLYQTVVAALGASLRAMGPDTRIIVHPSNGQSAEPIEVSADDLHGDLYIEIEDGEPTVAHEERMLQRYLAFLGAWLPMSKEYLGQPNETLGNAMDEMVKRAKMPEKFLTKNLRGAPPPEAAEVPRGPGAGSAVPGSASMPAIPNDTGVGAPGGPQPEAPMPPGIREGTTQNGVMPQEVM